jgi:hypothetical protein
MKVRVYYNLHKKRLSVQEKVNGVWKVMRHVDAIHLKNVSFKVSEAGRQRVLQQKRKNVHAFIIGEPTNELDPTQHQYQIVGYNPYLKERFFDGTKYVDKADGVIINNRLVYALNAR